MVEEAQEGHTRRRRRIVTQPFPLIRTASESEGADRFHPREGRCRSRRRPSQPRAGLHPEQRESRPPEGDCRALRPPHTLGKCPSFPRRAGGVAGGVPGPGNGLSRDRVHAWLSVRSGGAGAGGRQGDPDSALGAARLADRPPGGGGGDSGGNRVHDYQRTVQSRRRVDEPRDAGAATRYRRGERRVHPVRRGVPPLGARLS